MTERLKFDHLLIVPNLRVQNANAISSPLTHGFPSITAFLGLMWALERKTAAEGLDLRFKAVGVVCHDHQEQITESGFVRAFCLTRNPVGKDGSTAAIVEEGRIHLKISLVFALQSDTISKMLSEEDAYDGIAAHVRSLLLNMRIAGGSVIPSEDSAWKQKPYIVSFVGKGENFKRTKYRLLPGFSLAARDDLLETRHVEMQKENPSATRLDAWLSLSRINWHSSETESGKVQWRHDRGGVGWVVPISVGYGTLSGPHASGTVANARDETTPFCFVEGVYSIGQWLSPHRLQKPQDLLWYADYQEEQGLYRCRNDYRASSSDDELDLDFS